MKGRVYSRGEKKLEKNGKDRKETDIVKNEDPFVCVDECVKCGVIISKYVAIQKKKS
jgi:hypothetical protein